MISVRCVAIHMMINVRISEKTCTIPTLAWKWPYKHHSAPRLSEGGDLRFDR